MSVKKYSVLVVEDDVDLSEILGDKLRSKGHTAVVCNKISEALWKVRNQSYDLVILDLIFERGSGTHIIDDIRSDAKHINYSTPVLVVSGNLDSYILSEIKDEIDSILIKPFDNDTFFEKVEQIINRKFTKENRKAI